MGNKINLDIPSGHLKLEDEKKDKIRNFILGYGIVLASALYFAFGVLDFFLYPAIFKHLVLLRLITVSSFFALFFCIRKYPDLSFLKLQRISLLTCFVPSSSLCAMFFLIRDPSSVYWAGLMMYVATVGIGVSFSMKYFLYAISCAVIPLNLYCGFMIYETSDLRYLLGPIFLNGLSLIIYMGRAQLNLLETKEIDLRNRLATELLNRAEIIESKTQEALRLRSLSRQFSPQIITAIEEGSIHLDGNIQLVNICTFFIDLKDSTRKVNVLTPLEMQEVISLFMEDVTTVMLRHDMTIDKFLGDGVMGFTNSPRAQSDYCFRALAVGRDLAELFEEKNALYESLWKGKFEYRIGIATGPASVGFYGGKLAVKSFTAIGRVVNLASRVNGVAGINKMAVTADFLELLKNQNELTAKNLKVSLLPKQTLKGFEDQIVDVYQID